VRLLWASYQTSRSKQQAQPEEWDAIHADLIWLVDSQHKPSFDVCPLAM
jgi:hypothetical protein